MQMDCLVFTPIDTHSSRPACGSLARARDPAHSTTLLVAPDQAEALVHPRRRPLGRPESPAVEIYVGNARHRAQSQRANRATKNKQESGALWLGAVHMTTLGATSTIAPLPPGRDSSE